MAYDGDAPLDPVVHRVPARVEVDVRDVVVPVQVGAPRPRQRAVDRARVQRVFGEVGVRKGGGRKPKPKPKP